MNPNASPSSPPPVVDYATTIAAPPLSTPAVLIIWLAPVLLECLAWLLFFRPSPGDGVQVYLRNIVASSAGIPLFACSILRLIPPNSLPAYSITAIVSWFLLLTLLTRPFASKLPLIAHLLLSTFWTSAGCFLYLAMCL